MGGFRVTDKTAFWIIDGLSAGTRLTLYGVVVAYFVGRGIGRFVRHPIHYLGEGVIMVGDFVGLLRSLEVPARTHHVCTTCALIVAPSRGNRGELDTCTRIPSPDPRPACCRCGRTVSVGSMALRVGRWAH